MATLSHSANTRTESISANGSAGAGGSNGCFSPMWSTTSCVFGFALANSPTNSKWPQHKILTAAVLRTRAQDGVHTGVIGRRRGFVSQHHSRADHAFIPSPLANLLCNIRRLVVERFDEPKSRWVAAVDLEGVARIVAIHAPGRDQERAVDANFVHGSHHVVARHFIRPVQPTDPGSLGMVTLIGMHLAVDNRHKSVLFRFQVLNIMRRHNRLRQLTVMA